MDFLKRNIDERNFLLFLGFVNLIESESLEDEIVDLPSRNSFNLNHLSQSGSATPKKRASSIFRRNKQKRLTETEKRISMSLLNSPRLSSYPRLSMVHSFNKKKVILDQMIAQYDNYWCTTYEKVIKRRSIDDYRMNNVPESSTLIPRACFQKIEQPLYKDKRRLGLVTGKPMDAIVSHNVLNSSAFKGHFCDVFVEKLAEVLDFDSKSLNEASVQGGSIFLKKNKFSYEITPVVELKSWPEAATEFMRPVIKKPEEYPWPTIILQKCVKNQGLYLTPVGYLGFREENPDFEKEWKIECPKGEKYLLLHLLHAQVRCYLFALAIYKSFLELEEEGMSFGPYHLITLLFWQVKKNYIWPEAEPGFNFLNFLKIVYKKLQHRKLRDFFIHQRNLFSSSPESDLNKVLGKLNLILENPVPYTLIAIRNLKLKSNFYPKLDCTRLFKLATEKDVLTFLNPQLVILRKNKKNPDEEEIDEEEFEEDKEKWVRAQLRKQIESEKVANDLLEQARKSVDSIDVNEVLVSDKTSIRRQEILRVFIPHFIEMALKSKEYKAVDQCLMYLLRAKRLTQLLSEEPIDKTETFRHFERIDSIKLRCEKMKAKMEKREEETEENGEVKNENDGAATRNENREEPLQVQVLETEKPQEQIKIVPEIVASLHQEDNTLQNIETVEVNKSVNTENQLETIGEDDEKEVDTKL